jgi:type I restriction enzyme S subunit
MGAAKKRTTSEPPESGRRVSSVPPVIEEALAEGTFSVEKLVECFPVLVEAAGGADALRSACLRLAFSGRLTSQLTEDEPAERLLGALEQTRRALESAGKIDRMQLPKTADVLPYPACPSHWVVRPLHQVAYVVDPNPSHRNPTYSASGYPFISTQEFFGSDGLITDTPRRVAESVVIEQEKRCSFSNRSIAFSRKGTIGKTRILPHGIRFALLDSLCVVTPFYPCEVRFVNFALRAPQILDQLAILTRGLALQQVSVGRVRTLLVPIAPLAEQHRIVARVDQLMALIDELEAKQTRKRELGARFTKASLEALTTAEGPEEFDAAWKRVVENWETVLDRAEKVEEVRRAIGELAVRGKLSSANNDDEPVAAQLERIANEKCTTSCALDSESANGPFALPARWRWVKWGDIVLTTSSGWSPQCENRPRESGEWGVLKVSAVSWGVFKEAENKALPPGIQPKTEFAARAGDFLMSRANTADLVGRSVIVVSEPHRVILSDKLVRCVFSKQIDQQYINLYNRTSTARAHYLANASGTSDSMKNISRGVIISTPVPLPPRAEQERIVAKVDHLTALCDQFDAAARRSGHRASSLVESIMRGIVA